MSDKQCTATQPHVRHTNGHTHEFCPGLDHEFVNQVRLRVAGLDHSVVLLVVRVVRDGVGRIIYVEDEQKCRWSWDKVIWYKIDEEDY